MPRKRAGGTLSTASKPSGCGSARFRAPDDTDTKMVNLPSIRRFCPALTKSDQGKHFRITRGGAGASNRREKFGVGVYAPGV